MIFSISQFSKACDVPLRGITIKSSFLLPLWFYFIFSFTICEIFSVAVPLKDAMRVCEYRIRNKHEMLRHKNAKKERKFPFKILYIHFLSFIQQQQWQWQQQQIHKNKSECVCERVSEMKSACSSSKSIRVEHYFQFYVFVVYPHDGIIYVFSNMKFMILLFMFPFTFYFLI